MLLQASPFSERRLPSLERPPARRRRRLFTLDPDDCTRPSDPHVPLPPLRHLPLPHAPTPLLYPPVSTPTHTPCAPLLLSFFFSTSLGFAYALKTLMTALPLSLQGSRNSFGITVLLPPLSLPLALHFLRLLDIHTHLHDHSFQFGSLVTTTTSPCLLYYPTPPLTRCSPPPSLSLNDTPLTVALQPLFTLSPLRTPQIHCCHYLSRPKVL